MSAWRCVGPLLLLVVAGLVIGVHARAPLLINPHAVIAAIESGSIEQSSPEIMALLLPLAFIGVCFLLVALVVLMHAALSHEQRYLDMIAGLERSRNANARP